MSAGATIGRVRNATYQFYRWRYESAFLVNLGLAGLFACLTGFGALIKIYLPWTPVPITGQVFFVLASAVVLGKHYGGLSQILYAFVGILGVPWFAGSNTSPEPILAGLPGLYRGIGGFAILTGATFGYVIGFIVAAFLIGWALDARVRYRRPAYLALVLVAPNHDAGIGSLDVLHRDQLVDDPVEVGTVLRADQDDVVGVAHQEVDGPNARDLRKGLAQPLVGFRIVPRADEAHREDVVPELDRIHDRVVPFDDAFLLEPLDAVVDRGGGEPGLLRAVAEADLVVLLEPLQTDPVRALDV